jgi:hypothetical protein
VVRFSYRMVPEVYQAFWAGMAAGEFINDAAIAASSYRKQGTRWLAAVEESDLLAPARDIKVVQQMLGQKSATMTLDQCGHLFGDGLDVVADAMDAARAKALSDGHQTGTKQEPAAVVDLGTRR